ncbi:Rho termination factor N-terminal domain-containing protein [Micromonospora phytophila]|uniref:Rho termination factor N-terminal domain-containing protein n=1 Tax=Micromonospora phytophila TaxID=709888 RepID=UPI00202FEC6B|nr:Rho termination factor N-terminal domain-containing protein [Micromonospora phytophila]MCM0678764.1 Rho termination factor N-terminal domain-containing protein [Micromonospora phytophila]
MTDPLTGLVAALLRELSAEDVAALLEGRARLAVVPVDTPSRGLPSTAPPPATSAPVASARAPGRRTTAAEPPDRARAALAAMSTRDDGTAYLSGWLTRDLRALAASLELRGVAGLRKAELVERIVDRTIGYRLNSTAIRRL